MIDATQDIQTLNTSRENSADVIVLLKTTHHPITLTVDGQAEVVIQEVAAYQRLLDLAALADPEEGLRQGLNDIAEGRTRSARKVFAELREEYGIRG